MNLKRNPRKTLGATMYDDLSSESFLKILNLGFHPGEPVFNPQEEHKNSPYGRDPMNNKISDDRIS